MKYTADLPHPVRCTTSARRRCTTSASIAVHWSSRRTACGPASCSRMVCACSRVAMTYMVPVRSDALEAEAAPEGRGQVVRAVIPRCDEVVDVTETGLAV